MRSEIRACNREDIPILVEIIRSSFRDVAVRFGLTEDNAPRHPSNCTSEWVRRDMERGVAYFIIESNGHAVGCAALERADPQTCYLERLAVLPGHRRHGFGRALVEHVLSQARLLAAGRVAIGIIADHIELKDWYGRIGFVEEEIREFPHLPFRVTFMAYDLKKDRRERSPADTGRGSRR
ncbi:MAG: GNAT family N-acetyltransferase [Desulfomonilia bacterium]|jgi:N-acetylglutamate synthase-like GNAT family acetyltransferase